MVGDIKFTGEGILEVLGAGEGLWARGMSRLMTSLISCLEVQGELSMGGRRGTRTKGKNGSGDVARTRFRVSKNRRYTYTRMLFLIQDVSDIMKLDIWCHVHWKANEFHEVTDEAHDSETNRNCLADVQVLCSDVRGRCLWILGKLYLFVWALCTALRTAGTSAWGNNRFGFRRGGTVVGFR